MFVYVRGKKNSRLARVERGRQRARFDHVYVICRPFPLSELGCDAFSRLGIAVGWCVGEFEKLGRTGRNGRLWGAEGDVKGRREDEKGPAPLGENAD